MVGQFFFFFLFSFLLNDSLSPLDTSHSQGSTQDSRLLSFSPPPPCYHRSTLHFSASWAPLKSRTISPIGLGTSVSMFNRNVTSNLSVKSLASLTSPSILRKEKSAGSLVKVDLSFIPNFKAVEVRASRTQKLMEPVKVTCQSV